MRNALQAETEGTGEFRLVSTLVKKNKSVVAKIWFSACVENFDSASTVEMNIPRRGRKKQRTTFGPSEASSAKTSSLSERTT